MTVDELVALVEDITAGNTVADIRRGQLHLNEVELLEDESYSTLIDFIKGDRPTFETNPVTVRREVPMPPIGVIDEADWDDDVDPAELTPKMKRNWATLDGDGRLTIPTDRGGSIKLP